jgi:hypothetical protein
MLTHRDLCSQSAHAHQLVSQDLNDHEVEKRLKQLISQLAEVKWMRGPHWNGIGGKINPTTGKFSVGGSKECGHAIHRALTEPGDAGYKQIRA